MVLERGTRGSSNVLVIKKKKDLSIEMGKVMV